MATPQVKPNLDELSNVTMTSVIDGQIIKWDATMSKWINIDLATFLNNVITFNDEVIALNDQVITL